MPATTMWPYPSNATSLNEYAWPPVVHIPPKRPHKCPVCEGSGLVDSPMGINRWSCRACEGKGIVLEPEAR